MTRPIDAPHPRGALLLAAALLLGAASAQAAVQPNLLLNGSFEDLSAAAFPYYIRSFASTPGWTQFGDGVDLIHNTYTQAPAVLVGASDGVQFLDMNQAGVLGGILQTVAATPGQLYELSLDAAAWATNARGGTLGYSLVDPASSQVLASGSFTDPTGGTWVTRTLQATALSGSLQVVVQGLHATQAGMGVDNVRLVAVVPEPRAWALMLAGLGVVGALARRRG